MFVFNEQIVHLKSDLFLKLCHQVNNPIIKKKVKQTTNASKKKEKNGENFNE